MTITLNGTTGITNDGGYTGDGILFADTTPSNTLVTTTGGNVGVGTSSPGTKLHTYAATGAVYNYVQTGDGSNAGFRLKNSVNEFYLLDNASGAFDIYDATAAASRLTITSSGNVGIGTSSPTFATGTGLQVKGAGFTSVRVSGGSYTGLDISQTNSTGDGYVFLRDNAPLIFGTNNTERMRIDSSGNLLVGTTSTSTTNGGFVVGGSTATYFEAGHITGTGSGSYYTVFKYAGSLIGGITQNGTTAVAYNTTSDYRLKENVQPMIGALARVAALKPCTYTWKSASDEIGEGFIAHELAEVCPQAVSGEKDAMRVEQYEISPAVPATYDEEGNELTPAVEAVMGEREAPVYQGIDTSFLVATLTAAIQELKAIVDAQGAEIAALKGTPNV
jgi:hypothetical protein